MILEQYFGSAMAITGRNLGTTWASLGQFLDNSWAVLVHYLDNTNCALFGHYLCPTWTHDKTLPPGFKKKMGQLDIAFKIWCSVDIFETKYNKNNVVE